MRLIHSVTSFMRFTWNYFLFPIINTTSKNHRRTWLI